MYLRKPVASQNGMMILSRFSKANNNIQNQSASHLMPDADG